MSKSQMLQKIRNLFKKYIKKNNDIECNKSNRKKLNTLQNERYQNQTNL